MDAQNIVAVLVALIAGGVGKWVLDAVAQHRQGNITVKKNEIENQIAQNEQAVKIYNVVIEQVRKDLESLEKKCDELEKQYLSTREENAQLKAELYNLKSMITNTCSVPNCQIKPLIKH